METAILRSQKLTNCFQLVLSVCVLLSFCGSVVSVKGTRFVQIFTKPEFKAIIYFRKGILKNFKINICFGERSRTNFLGFINWTVGTI